MTSSIRWMKRKMSKKKSSDVKKVLDLLDKEGIRRPGKRSMDRVATGLVAFDESVGGGLVRGRIYEIAGNESAGKTTFTLECAKAIQALGQAVVYLDYEHALDIDYAESIGLDVSEDMFIFDQPQTLQGGLEVGYKLIESGVVGMVIVDSVAAMVPSKELDGSEAIAQQARAFSAPLRKYIGMLSRTNTIALFVNQVRADLSTWGSGMTTPGGKALKFFASVRMFLSARKSKAYDNGIRTKISIWKSKVSMEQRGKSEYEIRPGVGVVREEELLDIAKEKGLISERAGIFKIKNGDDDKSFRGREKLMEFLKDERARDWILKGT